MRNVKEGIIPGGLELGVGEVFRPFDRAITSLSKDFQLIRVAEYPFRFKGVQGELYLLQEDNGFDGSSRPYDWSANGLATPLGPVRKTIKVEEGDHAESLEDCPISIGLILDAHTPDELHIIQSHAIELTIGDRKFFLLPQLDTNIGYRPLATILEQMQETGLEKVREKKELNDGGKEVFIWLPYNREKLREIRARIVERPQFQS